MKYKIKVYFTDGRFELHAADSFITTNGILQLFTFDDMGVTKKILIRNLSEIGKITSEVL